MVGAPRCVGARRGGVAASIGIVSGLAAVLVCCTGIIIGSCGVNGPLLVPCARLSPDSYCMAHKHTAAQYRKNIGIDKKHMVQSRVSSKSAHVFPFFPSDFYLQKIYREQQTLFDPPSPADNPSLSGSPPAVCQPCQQLYVEAAAFEDAVGAQFLPPKQSSDSTFGYFG